MAPVKKGLEICRGAEIDARRLAIPVNNVEKSGVSSDLVCPVSAH